MFLEKRFELFPERHRTVVLRLVINVFRCVLDAGDTDAESPVARLPLEVPMLLERVVNPFGRIAFEA